MLDAVTDWSAKHLCQTNANEAPIASLAERRFRALAFFGRQIVVVNCPAVSRKK
jgi:hypothetical protein